MSLSPNEKRVFDFITACVAAGEPCPQTGDVADEFGWNSRKARQFMARLVSAGLLVKSYDDEGETEHKLVQK